MKKFMKVSAIMALVMIGVGISLLLFVGVAKGPAIVKGLNENISEGVDRLSKEIEMEIDPDWDIDQLIPDQDAQYSHE